MSGNGMVLNETGGVRTQRIRVHPRGLKTGITRTPEFEKKGLATHAVNVGTRYGHNCLYCSPGAVQGR